MTAIDVIAIASLYCIGIAGLGWLTHTIRQAHYRRIVRRRLLSAGRHR